jgi:hypothetical protein
MRPLRSLVAPLCVVAVLAVACTGDGSTTTSGVPTSASSQPSNSGSVPPTFTPGHFEYSNAGLTVTLELKEHTGTMEVDNGSGHDLGKPDLYVIDGVTTRQFDGKVLDAAPIPDGDQATFQVQFPPEVTPKSLGLVILLFGADNYGAFAPA